MFPGPIRDEAGGEEGRKEGQSLEEHLLYTQQTAVCANVINPSK